jgi:hypothetical protein
MNRETAVSSHETLLSRCHLMWGHRQPIDWPRILYARIPFAMFMFYMGLGRLGAFATMPASDLLPMRVYGIMLVTLALALALTHPWRYGWLARLVDVLAAALMATMAWDVGYISPTSLFEGTMAISFATHAIFNHDVC